MAATLVFASCSDTHETPEGPVDSKAPAYLSISIQTQKSTRGSSDDDGLNESDLKSIYLLTFDANGDLVGVPGGNYYTKLDGAAAVAAPAAVKVSAASAKLLVVVNPGTKLQNVLTGVGSTSSFSSINVAIKSAAVGEITDDLSNITKGFAMINSGDDTGKDKNDVISDPLIDLTNMIKKTSAYPTEDEAKTAAEGARVPVKLERLASKLEFKVKQPKPTTPPGASFTFGNWTVDAVNTTFFPYAEKTILGVVHSGSWYKKNFYTKDPNFSGTVGDGISYATINKTGDYSPQLVAPYTWLAADAKTYAIENTMAAAEQKYGNATRIVIKGTYYPDETWSGDWFNFAGTNYPSLKSLQDAYAIAGATNLQAACDKMFDKIKAFATANSITLVGTDFAGLITDDLKDITNGGEVLKGDKSDNDIIRWYKDGLSYYYYEIRHDNETTKEMDFGKYGIVRNNWYSITLGSVKGAGTPWYPSIDEPGPGDPDPEDPIDESAGYLGITIDIAPWIVWSKEIGV